jgi:ketose-bisphosphate aldolase
MFVVNSKKIVLAAYRQQKAIGAFNAHNLEIFDAIARAADKRKAPIIIQVTPATLDYFPPIYFKELVEAATKIYPDAPIALHLDHGKDLKQILECLEVGFSSVMIDASLVDFSENIKITKKVVKSAKRFRTAVEAEMGVMPNHHKNKIGSLVDVEQARVFVKETKIDFLAAPVGTRHGMEGPDGSEHINFEHLKKVFSAIKIPLVLHGSSGVSKDELKRARLYGIAKINFDTAIRKIYTNTLKKFLKASPVEEDPRVYAHTGAEAVEKLVSDKIKTFYF